MLYRCSGLKIILNFSVSALLFPFPLFGHLGQEYEISQEYEILPNDEIYTRSKHHLLLLNSWYTELTRMKFSRWPKLQKSEWAFNW